jgi:hypothetical protein|tara:strand:+ start:420 stop:698 length:279 start_codon:yes stop_codon:yes gene_type:complete
MTVNNDEWGESVMHNPNKKQYVLNSKLVKVFDILGIKCNESKMSANEIFTESLRLTKELNSFKVVDGIDKEYVQALQLLHTRNGGHTFIDKV